MDNLTFESDYLNDYLAMVEDTESPRLFHVWQALFNVSCALGRRCHFPFGPLQIFPNQYVLFVGTPGTRKSTAAGLGKKVLKSNTGVRFAPQDTAGQRQGIVAAMQGNEVSKEFLDAVELGGRDRDMLTLTDIMEITNVAETEEAQFVSEADKHHIAVVSTEFSRFIGQNNLQMLDFLATMWDGDDYEYQLKSSRTELKNPLINLVGCTTPTSIANSLPPAAGGQGFLSRIILVYGARKYKEVARPTVPVLETVDRVGQRLNDIYYKMSGPFSETPEAEQLSRDLYSYKIEITDSRFGYYAERRYTHLIKLSMVLAASRGTMLIEAIDVAEAHKILRATESGMPDALGEFGMNPLAAIKQEILEHLRESRGPMEMGHLIALFSRDARSGEIQEVVNDLRRVGAIKLIQQKQGDVLISANFSKASIEDQMLQILSASNK